MRDSADILRIFGGIWRDFEGFLPISKDEKSVRQKSKNGLQVPRNRNKRHKGSNLRATQMIHLLVVKYNQSVNIDSPPRIDRNQQHKKLIRPSNPINNL